MSRYWLIFFISLLFIAYNQAIAGNFYICVDRSDVYYYLQFYRGPSQTGQEIVLHVARSVTTELATIYD